MFSDEPYCHMVWEGQHASILAEPGMLEHAVAVYTFSKSYSMSGWRIGFAVAAPEIVEAMGKLINTSASCTPPLVQRAAQAALEADDSDPRRIHGAVSPQGRAALRRPAQHRRLSGARRRPGHFIVFPDVRAVCNRLGITSHGLALYLLEAADDHFGVACLGGSVSAKPGPASCGLAVPSPMNASTRRSIFWAGRSIAPTASPATSKRGRNTSFVSRTPPGARPVRLEPPAAWDARSMN